MKRTTKRISFVVTSILFVFIAFIAVTNFFYAQKNIADKPISNSKFALDTVVTITFYDSQDAQYIDKCFKIIQKYDNMFSSTKADSDISKINTHPNQYVKVNKDTINLLSSSIDVAYSTHGLFDPTIGKLTDLWNISTISKKTSDSNHEVSAKNVPSQNNIENLKSHVNYKNIKIHNSSVMLRDSNAKIDIGGIAKGYIADKLRTYLHKKKLRQKAIINLGGNIITVGNNSSDSFTIGIQKPFSASNCALGKIRLSNTSIVTSGIYERYFKCNSKIYHHILDTTTGYPVDNDLQEVTIITPVSTKADALSTSVFAMGLKKGKKYIESLKNTEAIFVTKDNSVYITSGIKNFEIIDKSYTLKNNINP